MIIKRIYKLENLIQKQKVLVLLGARRVGKTTLLNGFLSKTKLKYKFDTGDNLRVQQILSSQDFSLMLDYAAGYELIAIDEAHQIPNIGMGLKILVDHVPGITVIATGSSSFDLTQKIGEPLTGRKITKVLYPISQIELLDRHNRFELKEKLEEFLIFGSYPETITAKNRIEKINVLEELVNSYLLRDVFSLKKIKNAKPVLDLLKLLAFQIGKEVSLNELATQIKLDVKTVDRYLDILEKTFVIKRIGGFSRNLRKEVTSKCKYYFYDNGVRNGIISQFNSLADRNDAGELFENFVVTERMKKQAYEPIFSNNYFWRTYDQKEIDWIEEREGKLFGYEFKWKDKTIKAPKEWLKNYPGSSFQVVSPENYLEFVV